MLKSETLAIGMSDIIGKYTANIAEAQFLNLFKNLKQYKYTLANPLEQKNWKTAYYENGKIKIVVVSHEYYFTCFYVHIKAVKDKPFKISSRLNMYREVKDRTGAANLFFMTTIDYKGASDDYTEKEFKDDLKEYINKVVAEYVNEEYFSVDETTHGLTSRKEKYVDVIFKSDERKLYHFDSVNTAYFELECCDKNFLYYHEENNK